MHNNLKILIKSTYCNGWPNINVYLGQNLIYSLSNCSELTTITTNLELTSSKQCIKIERYGKTEKNFVYENEVIINDQTIEIVDVLVDDIRLPDWLIRQNCRIEFDDNVHERSRLLGPNGFWFFEFETPILTYLLDQKIIHEAKYSDNYKYPWNHQLGPDTVETVTKELSSVKKYIIEKL